MEKMNGNKVTRLDGIVTEILPALDNFSINKRTEIINEIYDSHDMILADLSSWHCSEDRWKVIQSPSKIS